LPNVRKGKGAKIILALAWAAVSDLILCPGGGLR